jgi:hypothetical protein
VVTFYPPGSNRKRPTTKALCSSAQHPDCTPKLAYETMLSEARLQTQTRDRSEVTNCLELERPHPVTIVVNPAGLEATTYTRPGHPSHPSKVTRIVKPRGDDVVIETTGVGKGGWEGLDAVDKALIDAVRGRLAPLAPPVIPEKPRPPQEQPDGPLSLPTSQPPPPPP